MYDVFKRFNELKENQRRMRNHIQGLMKAANQQCRDLKFHVAALEHLSTVVNRQNTRIQGMDEVLDAHEDKIQELRYDPTTKTIKPFKYDIEEDISTSFVLASPKKDVIKKWLPNVGQDTTAAPYSPEPEKGCDSAIYDSADTPSYEYADDSSSGKPDTSDYPQTQTAAPDAATASAIALASVPVSPPQQRQQPALPFPTNFNPQGSQTMPQAARGDGTTDPATAQSGPAPS